MRPSFHIAFPVDSAHPYAVVVRGSKNIGSHHLLGGDPEKTHLRAGSGADDVMRMAPLNDTFFQFVPITRRLFNLWLSGRAPASLGPVDLFTSGRSDGAACALAWLLADKLPMSDPENDASPIIFISCAVDRSKEAAPDFCELTIRRVAGNSQSGISQLSNKWRAVTEVARSHPAVFVLHKDDADLLLNEVADAKTARLGSLKDIALLLRQSSSTPSIIPIGSDDFVALATTLGVPPARIKKPVYSLEDIFDSRPAKKADSLQGLTAILRAENEVVPFVGRTEELQWLDNWFEKIGSSACLLTGAGGAGKTRLLVEWCHHIGEKYPELIVGWLKRGITDPDKLAPIFNCPEKRILLIIDKAESHMSIVSYLSEEISLRDLRNLKIVLLARKKGAWWEKVRAENGGESRSLDGMLADRETRSHFVAKVTEGLRSYFPNSSSRIHRIVEMQDDLLSSPLYTIAAVCVEMSGQDVSRDLLRQILQMESAHWEKIVEPLDYTGAEKRIFKKHLTEAVALFTLCGGATDEEAAISWIQNLSRDFELRKDAGAFADDILRPIIGGDPGDLYLHGLEPDLLGEELLDMLYEQKNYHPLETVFYSHDEAAKRHALTVLKRLATRKPEAKQWLLLAHRVAKDSADRFRKLAEKDPHGYLRTFSGSLMILASCYRDEGRLPEALDLVREATDIRRVLYNQNPSVFSPTLAGTLNSLSAAYRELGHHDKSLEATQEATEIYRFLAEKDPAKYLPILAGTLNSLSTTYVANNLQDQALLATQEAITLYRTLATRDTKRYRPILAGTLNCLGAIYEQLGKKDSAKKVREEAIRFQ